MMNKKNIIDIVAPASQILKKDFNRVLKEVSRLGFKPRFKGSLSTDSFFAQEELTASRNFSRAFLTRDSKIVWAIRGGYGSQRLLPLLDKSHYKKWNKKVFIGHSDTTFLHDWIHQNLQWPTLHFPGLFNFSELSLDSKKQISLFLQNKLRTNIQFKNLKLLNPKSKFKKQYSGKISGGNLTIIQNQIGTPWHFSRKNQILFLEDNNNEHPYSIHRALKHLKVSRTFQGVKAIVFGSWMEKEKEIMQQVLIPFAKEMPCPVLTGLPCGHTRKNKVLPLWTPARLHIQKNRASLEVSSILF